MTERYPNTEEFWQRMDAREVETDLRQEYRDRAARTGGAVTRLGSEATIVAFVRAILPGAAVPPEVLAAFMDANFDRQMGRGDERHGVMPRTELIPAGFAALDAAAGGAFHALDLARQADILATAERGQLPGPERFDSAQWFKRTRDLALLGYASDPRGMVEMGFPGPSYKPGYLWLAWGGPEARARRRPGHARY
jgi:hypothetical protein